MNKGQRSGLCLIIATMLYCKDGTGLIGIIMLVCVGLFLFYGSSKDD